MEEIDADCGNNLFNWRERKRTAIDHTHTHTLFTGRRLHINSCF